MADRTFFPEHSAVFADPDRASEFMLPLATVNLERIGRVHFVVPVDPWEGVVGEFTSEYHTYSCRPNWLGFSIGDDGTYSLATDYRFFERLYYETHPVSDLIHPNVRGTWRDEVNQHYEDTHASYRELKTTAESLEPSEVEQWFELNLDSPPVDANWSNMRNFAVERETAESQGDDRYGKTYAYPLTEDGRRFDYIGSISSNNYQVANSILRCQTLLFHDAASRLALLTFDWT